jgi:hypothetical protein
MMKIVFSYLLESFELDDEIIVEALAKNVGEKSINYYAGSSTCVSHLSIYITDFPNGKAHCL